MIDILGWICTILILLGYAFNSIEKYHLAFVIWIAGDIGWIIYDYHINNWSHATLSTIIILINIYGFYRKRKQIA